MTEIQILSSLVIVGAIVSVLMSMLKAAFGSLTKWKSKLVLIIISIVLAGVYKYLQIAGLWESALAILMVASTVYAFFIKK